MTAIRSLMHNSLRDNVSLFTSIHVRMAELAQAERGVHFNWLLSHSGVEGNEAADCAAHESTLLPEINHHLPLSVSLI